MIVGLDVGFGYTKRVTAAGTDVFPSVVGEWRADGFRLGARINGVDQPGRIVELGEARRVLLHER